MGKTPDLPLQSVPLADFHVRHGAKMVPFAGYEMPVQYSAGIMTEHTHTRAKAGLFDVSHMGQAWLHGESAAQVIERLIPGDVQALEVGQSRYSMITNDQGGIVDDLIVTNWGDKLFLVVNASRKDVDFPLIEQAAGADARLEIINDHALIALQGPDAVDVLSALATGVENMSFMTAALFDIDGTPCHVTRSGYTGEDGYEISVPTGAVEDLAEKLVSLDNVLPIGLGARDTLRLEAGLCLYGNDIDETTSPIEAGLTWTISKRRREAADFPGAPRILGEIADGVSRKRVGILPSGRAPARDGTVIHDLQGQACGVVTSGGFGPSVGGPVAMGYVPTSLAKAGSEIELAVRKNMVSAKVEKMPFQPHRYHRD